ncbi:MAG: 50S ribosomal protein L10 [Simkaniaceae bacterium]|nr:50S ribosomal protein L10 [Simkaniaceae bacterium]
MRQEKQLLLDQIKETMDTSNGVIVTSYESLDANSTAELRDQFAEVGAEFLAVKKRMLLKAAEELGFELEHTNLDGHIAILNTGENLVDATKALCKFAKDKKERLTILGGRIEGKLATAADVKQLSELPSRDEMRAQLLGLFEAPMSQTLATVEALLTSVIHCLNNKAEEEK